MQTAVRAVIFDLGGVLIDWNPDRILAGLYADPELRTTIKREVFQHGDWYELDKGTLAEDEAVRRFSRRTGRPVADMEALLQTAVESLEPIPESWVLVRELTAQAIPLYCLSNMLERSFLYLQRYNFWRHFEGVVISARIKLAKPERAIFDHLINTYNLEPAASVFVDDHLPNVEGARQAGLQGILFTGVDDCRSELRRLMGT